MQRMRAPAMPAVFAVLAAFVAGCSSLTPHVFSDLAVSGTTDHSLETVWADAAQAQGRYIKAARDQGNEGPLLGAALLGLSGGALYRGATGGNSKDIVTAGTLGALGLAYGNGFHSQPRLAVYHSGAEALGCAMAAVYPFRKAKDHLGKPVDDERQETLHGRRAAVAQRLAELELLLERHRGLQGRRTVEVPARPARDIRGLRPADCPVQTGATGARNDLRKAQCRLLPAQPVTRHEAAQPARKETAGPPAELSAAFRAARAEVRDARLQLATTDRAIEEIGEAGPLLWRKSLLIQTRVDEEVGKTVPNLASIMTAAGGLRSTAFSLTGVASLAPPGAGSAQAGRAPGIAPLTQADQEAIEELQQAVEALRMSRVKLDSLTSASIASRRPEWRKELNDCSVKVSGVQLTVLPAVDQLSVPAGSTQSFVVTGGSGVPVALVTAGPRPLSLRYRPEAGIARFEFTPPADVPAGSVFTLLFMDGGGRSEAQKSVEVLVAEKTAASLAGAGAASPFKDLTDDDLALLKLEPGAGDAEIQAAIDACQGSSTTSPPLPKTGKYDAATKQALKDGKCNPER